MDRILGQPNAIEQLAAARRSDRVHHAWIFSGPRGVGKRTTAVAFAASLLDPSARVEPDGTFVADPASETARLIAAGTHPDLHLIRKELALFASSPAIRGRKLTNIPVDVLREFVIGGQTSDDRYHDAPAYRKANLGHGKVFIVDQAELIDHVGQNALLKTLEEPPAETYLILVTSRPERLLQTIHSRCQHVRFGRLDTPAMAAWLDRAQLALDPAERAWVTAFAEGAPGIALLAAEHGFFEWHKTLVPRLDQMAAGTFPVDLGECMANLVETFATSWVKANKNASKDAANKDGAQQVLLVLAAHARARLAEACDRGDEPAPWPALIDLLMRAEQQLQSNVNMRQAFENLAAQWARVGETAGHELGLV